MADAPILCAMRTPFHARRIHALDTLATLAADLAGVVGAFYRALRKDGLSAADARVLTVGLLTILWTHLAMPEMTTDD